MSAAKEWLARMWSERPSVLSVVLISTVMVGLALVVDGSVLKALSAAAVTFLAVTVVNAWQLGRQGEN